LGRSYPTFEIKLMKQIIFLLLSLLIIPDKATLANEADLKRGQAFGLTQVEKVWLQDHPEIRLSPDPDFLPIESINAKGEYKGIAADYIALIEKKLGINFKILKYKNWAEVIEKSKTRESDMWGAATPTPQRLEYMLFTKPFIELPAIILVRENIEKSLSLKDLKGLKVAVISGYGIHDHLIVNNPEIKLDVVPDISTGLKKVSFGMVDAMIANIALATYYIENDGISNLRVAGESGFIYKWGFATRNDWPELNQILQKGINLIDENEKIEINRKWVGLKAGSSLTIKEVLVPAIALLGLFAIIAIIISNGILKRQVKKRTADLQIELTERKRIEGLLTTKNQMLDGYNHILKMLTVNHSFQEVLDSLVFLVEQQVDGMICSILLLDKTGQKLLTGSAPGLPDSYNNTIHGFQIGPHEGSCGTAAFTGKLVIVKDIANDPLWEKYKNIALSADLRACWSSPIKNSKGKTVGTFAAYYKKVREPSEEELELINSASHIAGIAIEHHGYEEEILNAKNDAESANRAKTDFLSRMSHELRTPLNAILGFGQLLNLNENNSLSTIQKLNTERILNAGNHLLNLVNDVLDLSRIEAGMLEVKIESFPLQTTLDEAIMLVRPLAEKTGIKITALRPDENNLFALADKARLVQVMLNLLTNSIKYNKESGSITINWEIIDQEKIRIHVKDTGMGIPKEMTKDIFEPFKRLDRDKITVQGAGIGLSITKQLLELMNGQVSAESTLGEGSCFTVELPIGKSRNTEKETRFSNETMELIKESDGQIPSIHNFDIPKVKLAKEFLSQFKEAVELNRVSRVEIFSNKLIQMGGDEEILGSQIKKKLAGFEMNNILEILKLIDHE
jgi:signal transduction histidine kinase/ABC-type amino acid transport substrate-binding protein